MEALKARGVCHSYGQGSATRKVLVDFDFTLSRGEFVALMGPSGSGKSTFLHLAAGLILPSSGNIEVAGKDVTRMTDGEAAKFRRRHEGIVFQAFNLLETVTVRDNIVLPAKLDRAKIDRARVEELMCELGLTGAEGKLPSELSGGERQRVAIARALYARPEVVLADEPTGNLDVGSSHAICALLRKLNESEKSAILLVTHDPVVASAANRVCFLKEGRIVASHDTKHDPAEISRLYLETYK